MKRIFLIAVVTLAVLVGAVIGYQVMVDPGSDEKAPAVADAAAQIARGRYLVAAGDCMACHSARGGSDYAGGRGLPTPFGTLYSPNITPDTATGIGSWSADDFWRALHNGKSRDGRFLYPAFPYTNYTKVTRADSDAMHAYLMSLKPVAQPNRPHDLHFPYNQRILLAGWRALYFRPGVYRPEPKQSVAWNRGAYLVQGLGHCNGCHTNRNALGAVQRGADLAGGMIPMQNWYAPSLTSNVEAGLGTWELAHITDLLKTGVSQRSVVFGPMAEVVADSLQHLTDDDAAAMATYLKALPQTAEPVAVPSVRLSTDETNALRSQGAILYDKHCASCHQASGAGAPPAYPPLAGNQAITMPSAINAIRMVANGGFPPSTSGNPRPYGMPPYGPVLSDEQIAAVVSYIRFAWGNNAPAVSAVEAGRYRMSPID